MSTDFRTKLITAAEVKKSDTPKVVIGLDIHDSKVIIGFDDQTWVCLKGSVEYDDIEVTLCDCEEIEIDLYPHKRGVHSIEYYLTLMLTSWPVSKLIEWEILDNTDTHNLANKLKADGDQDWARYLSYRRTEWERLQEMFAEEEEDVSVDV